MTEYDINKVSPRPWGYVRNIADNFTIWVGKKAEYIGAMFNEEDVAHIVHCVNMHDELVDQGAMYKSQRDEFLVTIAKQSEYLFEADKLKNELVEALEQARKIDKPVTEYCSEHHIGELGADSVQSLFDDYKRIKELNSELAKALEGVIDSIELENPFAHRFPEVFKAINLLTRAQGGKPHA